MNEAQKKTFETLQASLGEGIRYLQKEVFKSGLMTVWEVPQDVLSRASTYHVDEDGDVIMKSRAGGGSPYSFQRFDKGNY